MSKSNKDKELHTITNRFVPGEKLRDTPSRLFRAMCGAIKLNPNKWNKYLRDYLDFVVVTEDPERAKTERTTKSGNIRDTFFQKPTLSFPKFIEGMAILRIRKARITIEFEDDEGNLHKIEENIKLMTSKRANNGFKLED